MRCARYCLQAPEFQYVGLNLTSLALHFQLGCIDSHTKIGLHQILRLLAINLPEHLCKCINTLQAVHEAVATSKSDSGIPTNKCMNHDEIQSLQFNKGCYS